VRVAADADVKAGIEEKWYGAYRSKGTHRSERP